MGLVYVVIDVSTSKVITGTYEFDRANGGTLLVPAGTSFPVSPVTGELFWRTDEVKLYRRAASSWDAVIAVAAAHASSHQGGADPLTVDAAAGTGSLRTIGTGALQACAGNDARLSDGRTDANAIHKNVAAEISTITEKTTLVSADLFLIEDSADGNNKKRVQVANLPGGVDTTAIHKATAAEISAITEKVIPVAADLLLIEDSAAANAKKRLQIANFLWRTRDKTQAYLWEDFVGNNMDGSKWSLSVSGTGSAGGLLTTSIGGIYSLTSGGAATRYAVLNSGNKFNWNKAKNGLMEVRCKCVDLTDSTTELHLYNAATDSAYFIRTGAGNWYAWTTVGGVSTSTDTLVASDTNWHTFKIAMASAQIVFSIDGAVVATHSTNLPTAALQPWFIQRTTGGTATRVSYLDWVEITGDRD